VIPGQAGSTPATLKTRTRRAIRRDRAGAIMADIGHASVAVVPIMAERMVT
jgi:hypothetical protein